MNGRRFIIVFGFLVSACKGNTFFYNRGEIMFQKWEFIALMRKKTPFFQGTLIVL